MAWDVEYTDEFAAWWHTLSEDVQIALSRDVDVLRTWGPRLGRPRVDTISESQFTNMKELRERNIAASPIARSSPSIRIGRPFF